MKSLQKLDLQIFRRFMVRITSLAHEICQIQILPKTFSGKSTKFSHYSAPVKSGRFTGKKSGTASVCNKQNKEREKQYIVNSYSSILKM